MNIMIHFNLGFLFLGVGKNFRLLMQSCCFFSPDLFMKISNVTASCYRSLNALTEVEEPAGMGESLGTGAHRHRSILPPGVEYVPGPRVLRRILSNRS